MMIKENSCKWMSVGMTLLVLGLFAGPNFGSGGHVSQDRRHTRRIEGPES